MRRFIPSPPAPLYGVERGALMQQGVLNLFMGAWLIITVKNI